MKTTKKYYFDDYPDLKTDEYTTSDYSDIMSLEELLKKVGFTLDDVTEAIMGTFNGKDVLVLSFKKPTQILTPEYIEEIGIEVLGVGKEKRRVTNNGK